MNESTILVTNILIIVLILLFVYQQWRVSVLRKQLDAHHLVLMVLCNQTCEHLCICARQDYHLNRIPLSFLIKIILSQPFSNMQKFSHFQMAGIYLNDLEGLEVDDELKQIMYQSEQESSNKES